MRDVLPFEKERFSEALTPSLATSPVCVLEPGDFYGIALKDQAVQTEIDESFVSDAGSLIDETLGFEYVTLQALNILSSCEVHVKRVLSELSVSTVEFTPLGSHECYSMLVTEASNATNTTYDGSSFLKNERLWILCLTHSIDEMIYSMVEDEADEGFMSGLLSVPRRYRTRYWSGGTTETITISSYLDINPGGLAAYDFPSMQASTRCIF